MNRSEYLRDSSVEAFIDWLCPHVRGDCLFQHKFTMFKPHRDWSCNSIWEAYENSVRWYRLAAEPGAGRSLRERVAKHFYNLPIRFSPAIRHKGWKCKRGVSRPTPSVPTASS